MSAADKDQQPQQDPVALAWTACVQALTTVQVPLGQADAMKQAIRVVDAALVERRQLLTQANDAALALVRQADAAASPSSPKRPAKRPVKAPAKKRSRAT